MGNYYSTNPVEQNNISEDNSDLKIFNEQNTDIINKETQTLEDSEYNILLKKYKELEHEKNKLQEELDFFKEKYNNLVINIDSEEIIKQIIKKIN
jgi:hypothetical protein